MKTVLIIDDDLVFQEITKRHLRSLDCQIESAFTAPDGLKAARELRPDVIILDVFLPGAGIDGWGTAAQIRNDATIKDTPIIVVTAGSANTGSAAGLHIDAFFQKPFEWDVFLERVRQALG